MQIRSHAAAAATLAVLASLLVPALADARGWSQRRNYAEEWAEEDRQRGVRGGPGEGA